MVFWVMTIGGALIALSSGLLPLNILQTFLRRFFPEMTNEHIERVRMWLVISGVIILLINSFRNIETIIQLTNTLSTSQHELESIKDKVEFSELDSYRIKKFDVGVSIVDINGNEFYSYPSYDEELGTLHPKNAHELIFHTNKHHDLTISYIYEIVNEIDDKIDIDGEQIDILSKCYLKLHPNITINNSEDLIESENMLSNFLKGIFFIIKVNDVALHKFFIAKDEFKIENIREKPNYQERSL